MDQVDGQIIKLQAYNNPNEKIPEGEPIPIDFKALKLSIVLESMFDNLEVQNKDDPDLKDDDAITVINVDYETLKTVVEWMEHHKNDEPTEEVNNVEKRTDDIGQWDLDFMNVEASKLLSIVVAANYLHIKPLITLGCKTIVNFIKSRSPEEIREIFDIQDTGFRGDEEENIRKENEWVEILDDLPLTLQ